MTREDLLFQLRSLEIQLLDPELVTFIRQQDEAQRHRFVRLTTDLRIIITKLTTAQLAAIADRLDDLSDEIEAGIAGVQGAIDRLDNTKQIIDTLSSVIGLGARIIGLILKPLP
jgi:DNA-binding MarR family transcriptional regulator